MLLTGWAVGVTADWRYWPSGRFHVEGIASVRFASSGADGRSWWVNAAFETALKIRMFQGKVLSYRFPNEN